MNGSWIPETNHGPAKALTSCLRYSTHPYPHQIDSKTASMRRQWVAECTLMTSWMEIPHPPKTTQNSASRGYTNYINKCQTYLYSSVWQGGRWVRAGHPRTASTCTSGNSKCWRAWIWQREAQIRRGTLWRWFRWRRMLPCGPRLTEPSPYVDRCAIQTNGRYENRTRLIYQQSVWVCVQGRHNWYNGNNNDW